MVHSFMFPNWIGKWNLNLFPWTLFCITMANNYVENIKDTGCTNLRTHAYNTGVDYLCMLWFVWYPTHTETFQGSELEISKLVMFDAIATENIYYVKAYECYRRPTKRISYCQLFSLMKRKIYSTERSLCPIQIFFRMLQISLLNREER
jgi:hypothetical protein